MVCAPWPWSTWPWTRHLIKSPHGLGSYSICLPSRYRSTGLRLRELHIDNPKPAQLNRSEADLSAAEPASRTTHRLSPHSSRSATRAEPTDTKPKITESGVEQQGDGGVKDGGSSEAGRGISLSLKCEEDVVTQKEDKVCDPKETVFVSPRETEGSIGRDKLGG